MKKWFLSCGVSFLLFGVIIPAECEANTNVMTGPSLTISNASGFEYDLGETNLLTFNVTLSPASTQTVSVAFCTYDGSATTNNIDYIATNGVLVFQPGQTNKTITVQIIGDNVYEQNEYFYVQLFNATNAVIGSQDYYLQSAYNYGTAIGTIIDDDAIAISGTYVIEGDVGVTNDAVFCVQLAQTSAVPVSVAYTTANGTAEAGPDYLATNGIVTFLPGQTMQNITVKVLGDIYHEFEETFFVRLSGSTNSDGILLHGKQATGTIVDDDHFFFLTLFPASANEGTPGVATNQARFLVTLNQPSTNIVTVGYQTADINSADINYYFDKYAGIDDYTNYIPSFVFEGQLTPAVSGTDYVATNGTLTFLPGETNKYITVQFIGNSTPESDKPFLVALGSPVNAEIYNDDIAVGVIVDDDAFGTPVVTISNESVTEGDLGETNRIMNFHVQLNSVRHAPFTLSFTTTNGTPIANTATVNVDYVSTNGLLTFANGVADRFIPVTVLNDNLNETNEVFRVKLTPPAGVYWASNATYGGVGTIIDNDPLPYLTVSSYTNYEGDLVNNTAKFYVKLSAPSGRDVKVSYATANGSAAAGSDYKSASGTVTIPAGTTTNSISVSVYGDVLPEADETFYVNLSKPVNATIAVAQGLGLILNDDPVRTISIASTNIVEGNTGSNSVIFNVTLSSPCPQPVTVDYTTANGSAVAGSDYEFKSGALIFPPGVTNQSISVVVYGDITPELDEVFYVNLSNPFNASLGTASGACTILNDDGILGYVDHFGWSGISSTQYQYHSFPVTITALDVSNRTITNFTGPVALGGVVRSVTQDTNMLGNLAVQSVGSGFFTLGYSFTPATNMTVTHVRHFGGSKVSVWTDTGTLLATQSVVSVPGTWQETPLSSPLELTNGHTYRVGYLVNGAYYYKTPAVTSFADGVIGQNVVGFGDSFPTLNFNGQNFVDLRYTKFLTLLPISVYPTNSTLFTNGVWSGLVSVYQTSSNAFLSATDGDGHTGYSGPFQVLPDFHMGVSLGYELISTNGAKQFKVIASMGQAYVIESSTNLVNWSAIYTNQTGLAGCDCVDLMPTNSTRFYRARKLP